MTSVSWIWIDTHPYLINALRRIILSDLDVVAIPNKILKKDDEYGIKIHKNSGKLHNEFIAHRISMLPINLIPSQLAHGIPEFVLNKKQTGILSGKDIQIKKQVNPLYSKFEPNIDYVESESIIHNSFKIQCPELLSILKENKEKIIAHINENSSPMITRLYDSEELDITMRPSISTAKENGGHSLIKQCNFIQQSNPSNYLFQIHTIDTTHDMQTLIRTSFDKLLLRLRRLQNYVHGGIEICVGSTHVWLQDVIDPTCKANLKVNGKLIYGITISCIHGSKMCLTLPPSFQLLSTESIESIIVEALDNKGEIEFKDITITRHFLSKNIVSTNPFIIRMDYESYTLGNLIQGHMFKTEVEDEKSQCNEFSFSKPYPLDDYILFRIGLHENATKDDYFETVYRSVDNAIELVLSEKEKVLNSTKF